MHAMILAAGRGERLRPITDTIPKALVIVRGRPLIEWQVTRLAVAGFTDLVVNCAWLGEQIRDRLGSGKRFDVRIRYSIEPKALETLGGVVQARPMLGRAPFVVTSADIHTDFNYASLLAPIRELDRMRARRDAHLVFVDNPPWHPAGDMAIESDTTVSLGMPRLTYANIGVFHPRMFVDVKRGTKQKLFPWAYQFVEAQRVSGSHYRGVWHNIGTVLDLAAAADTM